MLQPFEELHTRRIVALVVLCVFVFVCGMMRAFRYQAVEGETFLASAQQSASKTVAVEASRGTITDRNGVPFTQNKISYNVELDYTLMKKKKRGSSELDIAAANKMIYQLIKVMENLNASWIDDMPITKTEPYQFLSTASDSDLQKLKHKIAKVNDYATAEDCLYWLYQEYQIKDQKNGGYPESYRRKIAGVWYEMLLKEFSSYNTRYTFAEKVPAQTAAWLEEQSSAFPGLIVVEKAARGYISGDVASQLIGTVGPIYQEQYSAYQKKGYQMSDIVGKSGIERAMESQLRGKDGVLTVQLDSKGDVVNSAETIPATAGNTVQLTIDYNFQKEVQKILSDYIAKFNASNRQGKHVTAASIVVLDKTGGVLACVSYPYYDINEAYPYYFSNTKDYVNSYLALSKRVGKPLNNWALNGLYRPGSTFKPIVAAGALTEGVITPSSTVYCDGVYHYYASSGFLPTCLQIGHHDESLDLRRALKYSCNVFFYDTGRRLGIEKMDKYAKLCGLGTETGLEITNATGCLTTKNDPNWEAGNVVQAAIGQMNTQITPLQMSLEALTIANHGIRYKAHLVKEVTSYDGKKVVQPETKEVMSRFSLSDSSYQAISDGMILVGQGIKSPNELTDLGYQVAVKTGTPQVTKTKTNNGFIAFAPVNNPQIAIGCMVQDGYNTNVIIRQILKAYEKTQSGSNLRSGSTSSPLTTGSTHGASPE